MLDSMERRDVKRRLTGAERRQSIIDAAYGEFAARGYAAVSMREIAARLGVTSPALYRQFPSKADLYRSCADRMVATMLTTVSEATDPELPADGQLWAGICAQLRFIAEHQQEWSVFVREAEGMGGEPEATLIRGRDAVTALLADLIGQAARSAGVPPPPSSERAALAHALQGAVERIAQWWERNPDESVEAVALRVMNFSWQGFGNLLEGRIWTPPE